MMDKKTQKKGLKIQYNTKKSEASSTSVGKH